MGGTQSVRQRETELTTGIAALAADKIDLHEPGSVSSWSCQVRISIRDFNNVPGLVCDRPRTPSRDRAGANRRSIVAAADIVINIVAVSSSIVSSP